MSAAALIHRRLLARRLTAQQCSALLAATSLPTSAFPQQHSLRLCPARPGVSSFGAILVTRGRKDVCDSTSLQPLSLADMHATRLVPGLVDMDFFDLYCL